MQGESGLGRPWPRPVHLVHNAVVLEEVAKMAFLTSLLNPKVPMNSLLIDKHFGRKHGPDAYYGQK